MKTDANRPLPCQQSGVIWLRSSPSILGLKAQILPSCRNSPLRPAFQLSKLFPIHRHRHAHARSRPCRKGTGKRIYDASSISWWEATASLMRLHARIFGNDFLYRQRRTVDHLSALNDGANSPEILHILQRIRVEHKDVRKLARTYRADQMVLFIRNCRIARSGQEDVHGLHAEFSHRSKPQKMVLA